MAHEADVGRWEWDSEPAKHYNFKYLMSVPGLLKKNLAVNLISAELVPTFTSSVCHFSLPKLACMSAVIFVVFVCKFGQLPF